ncbi:MAG TPA: tetratricopeptide repeat protein [Nitrospiraceae bacterium]|nr:tetratricopeptide repeat protein [Nitrospiraceae bacterium]
MMTSIGARRAIILSGLLWISTLSMGGQPASAQIADAVVLVAEAVLAYDAKRYDEAIPLLTKAVALDPGNARALYYLGLCYLARDQAELAIPPLSTLHGLRPTDAETSFQLGTAYFATKQYDRAKPLLEEAFRRDPDRENLGFYVGVLRYQEKDYAAAAEALDANRSKDPDIRQLAMFYHGLALGTLGLSDQARTQLSSAQQVQPSSPVTGASVRVLEALGAAGQIKDNKRFQAQVAIGGYYDDNVAVNPRRSNDAIAEALRSRPTQSPGFVTSAHGEYAWYRKGPVESNVNYSYYQTVNTNSGIGTFDIQSHMVGLSGAYRGTAWTLPYQLGGHYTYDYMFLGFRGFLARHSVTLPATLVPPGASLPLLGRVDHLSTLLYRFQRKDFFTEPANSDPRFAPESRDAYNNMIGYIHAFRFDRDKYIVRLGYQFDSESASGSSFSYQGNRLQLGGQASMPWSDVTLRLDYEIHWRAYSNAQVFFADDAGNLTNRQDIEQDLFVQLAKPLPYRLTWAVQYQGVFNHSNIPVYAYSKNVFTTLLTWTY